MHLLDQRILGLAVLALLVTLVVVKRVATGSILDAPKGSLLVQLVNTFNLFFLLIVNPLVALLLILRRLELTDPTHIFIRLPRLLTFLEIAGFAVYVLGYLLMMWALIALGRKYQLGGSVPRPDDAMVSSGPYQLVRHPMYAAALCIALGLTLLTESLACFLVFWIYLALMLVLIPGEEDGLRRAYGERYTTYQRGTSKLFPSLYRFRRPRPHRESTR
jgi:protein-S-isoprenylcysteine O-methyltransferase Ste14